MSLHVEKLPRTVGYVPCEAGCVGRLNATQMVGRRVATHRVVILGHDVSLCSACAREWVRAWDEALEPVAA